MSTITKYQSPSNVAEFPFELLELIFLHIEHDKENKYYSSPIDLRLSGSNFCRFSLVCKRWAVVGQEVIWRQVDINSFQTAQRLLASSVFGQLHITQMRLGLGVPPENAVEILERLRSLTELIWQQGKLRTATWWNNDNLTSLTKLTLWSPLEIPKNSKPRFQLKELSIFIYPDKLGLVRVGKALQSIIESCASTMEVFNLWANRLPSWFNRRQLPKLRTLRTHVSRHLETPLQASCLQGVTHISFHSITDSHIKILNLQTFPSTLESLEIFSKCGFSENLSDIDVTWPTLFETPFGDDASTVPNLRRIRVIVPNENGVYGRMKSSVEELHRVDRTRAFWARHNVVFDVDWDGNP